MTCRLSLDPAVAILAQVSTYLVPPAFNVVCTYLVPSLASSLFHFVPHTPAMFSGPVAWKLDRETLPLDRGTDLAPPKEPAGTFQVQFTDAVTVSMSIDTETHKQIADDDAATVENLVGIYWKISEDPVF